jgi:exonuclease III
LLTMWDTATVEVWSSISLPHVLLIHGQFLQTQTEFFLFNVYAPWDTNAKLDLWGLLTGRLQQLGRQKVCVCGDFNAVRSDEERRSVRHSLASPDQGAFNQFIDDNDLVDLPLCGRSFTWYKGDGRSMSRIDRFLLSEDWCLVWPKIGATGPIVGAI